MRHRQKKSLKLRGAVQSNSATMRTMLTNLVRYGHLTTTSKTAFVLVGYADAFFAHLMKVANTRDPRDAEREIIRWIRSIIYTADEGKKIARELIPSYKNQQLVSNFTSHVKLGKRKGDAAEEVRIELMK